MADYTHEQSNNITNRPAGSQLPVIDDLDYLAVLIGGLYLYRYNRTTMAFISSTQTLSYYNK
jgi:hypothetical protein